MPSSSQSSYKSVEELTQDVSKKWYAEFQKEKAKWDAMSPEQRDAYAKAVFDALLKKVQKNPLGGFQAFVQFLISPRGALVWPWIWKEPYRPLIIDITKNAYELMVKLGVAGGGPQ